MVVTGSRSIKGRVEAFMEFMLDVEFFRRHESRPHNRHEVVDPS